MTLARSVQIALAPLLLLLAPFGAASGRQLAPDSPLAHDEEAAYAVAGDRRTLLTRPLETGTSWAELPLEGGFEEVSALGVQNGWLFVVDAATASIHRIELPRRPTGSSGFDGPPSPRLPELLHRGPPLRRPVDLAVDDVLVVADPGAGRIFLLSPEGGEPVALSIGDPALEASRFYVATADDDLIVTSPDTGTIALLSHFRSWPTEDSRLGYQKLSIRSRPTLRRLAPQTTSSGDFVPSNRSASNVAPAGPEARGDDSSYPGTGLSLLSRPTRITPRQPPPIAQPGPVSIRDGIAYLVDESTRSTFAVPLHRPQPIPILLPGHAMPRPARIRVTEREIVALDPEAGALAVAARTVPAEVRFEAERSEAMAAVYVYMNELGILPTRSVPLRRNVETTLREEGVLLAPYVAQLDELICDLNPKEVCGRFHLLDPRTRVVIPDLYAEHFVGRERVKLHGQRSLGMVVDRRVPSEELRYWRSEEALQRMNPVAARKVEASRAPRLRDQWKGVYSIPTEYVRYYVSLPVSDIESPNSELARIRRRWDGISVFSLAESVATKAQAGVSNPLSAEDQTRFRAAYQALLAAVNYPDAPPTGVTPYVGVVEAEIDCDHPDLQERNEGGVASACEPLEQFATPDMAAVPPLGPSVRARVELDHGTMIAWLIAGRGAAFEGRGLAPHSVVIPIAHRIPPMTENIADSELHFGARIFNMSFSFSEFQPKLHDLITGSNDPSLFVVAAGNHSAEICTDTHKVYPACWSDRPNVLVVAATDLDGQLAGQRVEAGQTVPGSNYSREWVQVAAPGRGYFLPGLNHSYVPADGSSFATSLVTATAALLYAQGVTRAAHLKQRIVATADPDPLLPVQGGRLNVERAVRHPHQALLTDRNQGTFPVEIDRLSKITIFWSPRGETTVHLRDVRRLTFEPSTSTYRIVYVEGEDRRLPIQIRNVTFRPGQPWRFRYKKWNAEANHPEGGWIPANLDRFDDFVGALPST